MILSEFRVVDRLPGYDAVINSGGLSVVELLPIAVSWCCGDVKISIECNDGIFGLPLGDLSGVAIVEAPYDLDDNRAYVVNSDGSVRFFLKSDIDGERVVYWEIEGCESGLNFIANANGRDIRIVVDPFSGRAEVAGEFR